jgi:hypothetical protein
MNIPTAFVWIVILFDRDLNMAMVWKFELCVTNTEPLYVELCSFAHCHVFSGLLS